MRTKRDKHESFERLDKLAHENGDVRPLSAALRRDWKAARRSGKRARSGRPRKDPRLKARIVPISIDPTLLAEIDQYARSAGLSRSALVAEGLRLRLRSSA